MDSRKLLRTLTTGHGAILVPHIEAYQARAIFPDRWEIEIRNFKVRDPYFHPSSDCFTAPIDLWRQKRGLVIQEKISPSLRRTFDCGHMWHGYLQAILVDMKFVRPDDVEYHITHEILTANGHATGVGTIDLNRVQIPGSGEWLVDIKTMNKLEFERGANDYTMMKWKAQVNCYMDWSGHDKAMILAISKDSPHDMREYQIQRDEKLLGEIYDRWTYTAYHLREDKEPDVDWQGYNPPPELLIPGDTVPDLTT